jgi:hypothetical protein
VESGRLEAFSDGVFAVAITLLALNLVVPGPGHSPLAEQLASHWPVFAAFAVSFLTIGIIWVNHHALFRNFAKIDRPLLFLNLLLLFFIVSIPFATATIADYLTRGGGDLPGSIPGDVAELRRAAVVVDPAGEPQDAAHRNWRPLGLHQVRRRQRGVRGRHRGRLPEPAGLAHRQRASGRLLRLRAHARPGWGCGRKLSSQIRI